MGLQDFLDEAKESLSDVQDFLSSKEVEPLIKIGVEPQGNLTAADIEAGKTASVQPVNPEVAGFDFKKWMIPVLGLGAAYFFFFKKSRRQG